MSVACRNRASPRARLRPRRRRTSPTRPPTPVPATRACRTGACRRCGRPAARYLRSRRFPPRPSPPAGPAYVAGGRYPLSWFPAVPETAWRYIVIHHSATSGGGARKFDAEHKAQGWDELGYHFVVGNGTDTADGQIEVGPRWPKQKHGAHAKTPDQRYNNFGIGICLVGNFDDGRPSPRQVQSAETLIAFLMQRYRIPPERVIGHQDTGKSTDCPGHYLEAMLPDVRRIAAREAGSNYLASVSQ